VAKRDYYEVLGVEKTATLDEIKKAYRKLAIANHPDRNQGDKAAEDRFKEATEAYDVLSDEKKRQMYDQFGFAGVDGGSGPRDYSNVYRDFSDIFGSGFGGGFEDILFLLLRGSSVRQGPMQGEDLRYDLTISFEEAAMGCSKEITLVRDEACEQCKGTGARPGTHPQTCPTCKGSGQERVVQNTPFGRIQNVRVCGTCHGEGKIVTDPCPRCNGRGLTRTSKRRTIKIPAGIDDGQVIRISGQGGPGVHGGPAGDLQVLVHVRPHKYFKRKGTDLYCDVPISFTQAALGAEIDVPTLEKPVKYQVPEGTQPGTVFRIKGQGIPSLRGSGKGDLFVQINVEIPKRLSERQKEILRQFDGATTGREYEQKKSFIDRMKDAFN